MDERYRSNNFHAKDLKSVGQDIAKTAEMKSRVNARTVNSSVTHAESTMAPVHKSLPKRRSGIFSANDILNEMAASSLDI